jgi:4-oxalomesaconate tautomerase
LNPADRRYTRSMQQAVRCLLMRGGTSKGAYFLADDLPADPALRDRVILAAFGSPDPRQIDGIGGAHPLTSKAAIISRSRRPDADVDYLFGQIVVNEARVDYSPTCGNILAGVGPFALERGLLPIAAGDATLVRIYMVNTDSLCVAQVPCAEGAVDYSGTARISGVPGTAAPILLTFVGTEGSSCGALLPTGQVRDEVEGIAVTCIDNGMPVVLMQAAELGCSGYESPAELDANTALKGRIEAIRRAVGPRMNLGDVRERVVPKMTLIAPPRAGGSVSSRTFIPHVCHDAIGVLGAVSVATACALPGSVAHAVAALPPGDRRQISVEHPTGEFSVDLETRAGPGGIEVTRSSLLRTARALFDGRVLVPAAVADETRAAGAAAAH